MRYEYYKGRDGDWYWRFRAANGRITKHGEGYSSKSGVLRAIRSESETAYRFVLHGLVESSEHVRQVEG